MPNTSDDDITRALEISAQRAAGQRGQASALPPDPALPPDAAALRLTHRTPLEILMDIANDMSHPVELRLSAAGKALSTMHRAPAARQEIAVTSEEAGRALFQYAASAAVTDDALDAAIAATQARIDAKAQAH